LVYKQEYLVVLVHPVVPDLVVEVVVGPLLVLVPVAELGPVSVAELGLGLGLVLVPVPVLVLGLVLVPVVEPVLGLEPGVAVEVVSEVALGRGLAAVADHFVQDKLVQELIPVDMSYNNQ